MSSVSMQMTNIISQLILRQRARRQLNEAVLKYLTETYKPKHKRKYIHRNHAGAHNRIVEQYFSQDESTCDKDDFKRRFRMQRSLFTRILIGVQEQDPDFIQKADCTGRPRLSALQKMVAALDQLTSVIAKYGAEYLRVPTNQDIERLIKENAARGFPGMIGSLDSIHWRWKNCPRAWHGRYEEKEDGPTLALEAVVSQDLWIWHACFGLPGSDNDISVLDSSHLFNHSTQDRMPKVKYSIDGHDYDTGYYLVDDEIYPDQATYIKATTAHNPETLIQKAFTERQESVRKDVERAFDALQSRFAIVSGPTRSWKKVGS